MENISGQWLGKYEGTNYGDIILNIELRDKVYQGKVILIDKNNKLPILLASILFTELNQNEYQGTLSDFLAINPYTKLPFNLNELQYLNNLYPSIKIPASGIVENISIQNNKMSGEWKTNHDTKGKFEAQLRKAAEDEKQSQNMDWEQYQKHIHNLEKFTYIFRGQSEILPLRTTFHRCRSDLSYYSAVDVPRLHRHITAETGRLYNLANGFEHGALLYLAQHHGFPTPLLDWTHSPFIAAFFAYRDLSDAKKTDKVRIYQLNSTAWNKDFPYVHNIDIVEPAIIMLELMAINNNRAIPQQSITMFTNMDDVEGFILQKETEKSKEYLTIIDLPASEKKTVMEDLFRMGISASSMFPGLDGICKMLNDVYFK